MKDKICFKYTKLIFENNLNYITENSLNYITKSLYVEIILKYNSFMRKNVTFEIVYSQNYFAVWIEISLMAIIKHSPEWIFGVAKNIKTMLINTLMGKNDLCYEIHIWGKMCYLLKKRPV